MEIAEMKLTGIITSLIKYKDDENTEWVSPIIKELREVREWVVKYQTGVNKIFRQLVELEKFMGEGTNET